MSFLQGPHHVPHISSITTLVHMKDAKLKVIIETALLTKEEKISVLESLNQHLSEEIDALEAATEGNIPEEVLEEIKKLGNELIT